MCMALYLASDRPLRLTKQPEYPNDGTSLPTWPREAQRFQTATLQPKQEAVRSHFSHPHVLYAGSYEGCGCGFNYGREYPEAQDEAEHLTAARESIAELVRYVRESGVREIYRCWFDEEAKPTVRQRTVTPETLSSPDFVFGEQELLRIDHDASRATLR
jgi:hypothetical protein